MKKATMPDIKETLAEAIKLDFHSANTGVKRAFTRFLEMVLGKMIHQKNLDFILI